ncbi:unnamed protein product [[Candida] boidinii]|nr:unnamed protein product [[Candida] boidinii]GMG16830.1 unnamed protein product [[Candida] boidinii]
MVVPIITIPLPLLITQFKTQRDHSQQQQQQQHLQSQQLHLQPPKLQPQQATTIDSQEFQDQKEMYYTILPLSQHPF